MIKNEIQLDIPADYYLKNEYNLSKTTFFDIETTGFAADTSYLYLIGCIYYKNHSFNMIQWFAENINEEINLIKTFFDFLSEYTVLIHYNGSGFDIPYLLKKCLIHNLNYNFDHVSSIDLYKKVYPYKKIFKLDNYKQKSIEAFLGIKRMDTYGGGELINIYQSYIGRRQLEKIKELKNIPKDAKDNMITFHEARNDPSNETKELLRILLLHNADDLKGLVYISPIMNYVDLFEKPIHILQAGVDGDKLVIKFDIASPLPVRISYGDDVTYLTAFDQNAYLHINVYDGELKYFYDNYKDYYYLPMEDTAVHKSVAMFVDKEFRQQAKAFNCYIKKSGIFAPQYKNIISPCFKYNYRDRLSFFEINTDFLLNEENLKEYVSNILLHIMSNKTSAAPFPH